MLTKDRIRAYARALAYSLATVRDTKHTREIRAYELGQADAFLTVLSEQSRISDQQIKDWREEWLHAYDTLWMKARRKNATPKKGHGSRSQGR